MENRGAILRFGMAAAMIVLTACGLAAAGELSGRVVEAGTAKPVEGFTVRITGLDKISDAIYSSDPEQLTAVLRDEPDPPAWSKTDDEGRFRFEHEFETTLIVVLEPRVGWTIVGDGKRFVDIGSASAANEVQFQVRRSQFAKVRLSVKDDDGRPVPHCRVEIARYGEDDPVEILTTDDAGNLVSETPFEEGMLQLRFSDHPGLTRETIPWKGHHHLGDGDREYEVNFDPGLTCFLELDLPPGVTEDDLTAELLGPPGTPGARKPQLVRTPVRRGDKPWVRFHSIARVRKHPAFLRVTTRDGRWSGAVELDRSTGMIETPLAIALGEHGSIQGQLVDENGAPTSGADVRIRSERLEPIWTTTADDGGFRIDWLAPDTYEITAITGRHRVETRSVELGPGKTETIPFGLEIPTAPLQVRGKLFSAAGHSIGSDAAGLPGFFLRSVRPYHPKWTELELQPGRGADGLLGSFAAENLAPDEYEVVVRSSPKSGYARWDVGPPIVPAVDDLRFVRLDDQPGADLGFLVVDAQTGQAMRSFISIEPHEQGSSSQWGQGYQPVLRDYPLDAPLHWIVSASGYAPVFGDESGFTHIKETPAGSVREAHVGLLRGWGVRIRVTQGSGAPVEGVELTLDEESVGRTDPAGILDVYLPKRPTGGRLTKSGWRDKALRGEFRETLVEIVLHPG